MVRLRLVCRRDALPPRIQRVAVAAELDAHAAGKLDPVGETVCRDGDHHGNVGIERALDQIGKALALALALAEAVDDHEVGAARRSRRRPARRHSGAGRDRAGSRCARDRNPAPAATSRRYGPAPPTGWNRRIGRPAPCRRRDSRARSGRPRIRAAPRRDPDRAS